MIRNSFLYQRFRRWQASRLLSDTGVSPLMLTTVAITFGIGVLSFFTGLITSSTWQSRSVSLPFLVAVVLLPFVSVAIAFALLMFTLYADYRKQLFKCRQEVGFLSALDSCETGSSIRMVFIVSLLNDWRRTMLRLKHGVVTIQGDALEACSHFFHFAYRQVECTSSVPIEWWDEVSEEKHDKLIAYKNAQKVELLTKRGIPITRTFIITEDELKDDHTLDTFLRVALSQMREGFIVRYLELQNAMSDEERKLLKADFALIDGELMMIGDESDLNPGTYEYTFFDFFSISSDPKLFVPALRLCANAAEVCAGVTPQLLIEKYRKKMTELPCLALPKYDAYKISFEQVSQ